MHRPSWDKYFLDLLPMIASRSTCIRHKFGAIVARDNHLLTTGYNGAVSCATHCTDIGSCWRNELKIESGTRHEICSAVHAEQNAIVQAAKLGVSLKGSTIYISETPCIICSKMIVNSGIRKVILSGATYPDLNGLKIIKSVGIPIILEPGSPSERHFALCPKCGKGKFIGAYGFITCSDCAEVH